MICLIEDELTTPVKPELMRIWFEVPFDLKDNMKSLGGRWDAEKKKWYKLFDINTVKREDLPPFKIVGGKAEGKTDKKWLSVLNNLERQPVKVMKVVERNFISEAFKAGKTDKKEELKIIKEGIAFFENKLKPMRNFEKRLGWVNEYHTFQYLYDNKKQECNEFISKTDRGVLDDYGGTENTFYKFLMIMVDLEELRQEEEALEDEQALVS
jgi:hypothetical protein